MPRDVLLVVAPRDGGKTTRLTKMIEEDTLPVGGVLALANPEKTLYTLKDLCTGEIRQVLSPEPIEGAKQLGRFYINEQNFAWANQCIIDSLRTVSCVYFDEIGRLELSGGGLSPSFRKALEVADIHVVAAVRDAFVDQVIEYFKLDDYHLQVQYVEKF